jgi:hypothetical protein
MPKNSRRKKDVRRHAVRKGERYMRAWHSTGPTAQNAQQAPSVSAAPEIDYLATGFEPIHRIQRVLESRTWVVTPSVKSDLDAHGMAADTDVMWDYAPAFRGVEFEEDDMADEIVPTKPNCHFDFENPFDNGWIVLQTAGNWGGCEQHRIVSHRLPLTEAGIAALPQLLAKVEAPARTLDPTPFIQCLAHGPCAEHARQREKQRDCRPTQLDRS